MGIRRCFELLETCRLRVKGGIRSQIGFFLIGSNYGSKTRFRKSSPNRVFRGHCALVTGIIASTVLEYSSNLCYYQRLMGTIPCKNYKYLLASSCVWNCIKQIIQRKAVFKPYIIPFLPNGIIQHYITLSRSGVSLHP
jgi:hypothetical protein